MVMDLSSFQMIEMAVFDTSTLTTSYEPMNGPSSYLIYTGSGFQFDIKVLEMYNGSNVGVIVSLDGVTRNAFLPVGGTKIIDLQANHADFSSYGSGTLNGRAGQILYGSGGAGSGNVYISGYR